MTGGAVHSINTGHASHKPISSALRWAAAIRRKSPIFRDLRGGATVRPASQLIRCVLSRLSGVAVYLRRDSPSFWKWICVENDAARGNALHVAKDCAQGFLALIDDTLADYHMSAVCVAELARGARRNDPTLAIAWPFAPPRISERVSSYLDHCT
jgi:dTDP-4-dehydrorhamnose 3,5-epimerase-like enzyme